MMTNLTRTLICGCIWRIFYIMRIWLVRHGRRVDAEADVSQKHDSPLSESGKKELSQVREWFEGLDIHKVYYSPYERARQTAVELFGHRNLPTEELDFVH